MKILILKFARGGSQIGGRYADYAASYTPLEVSAPQAAAPARASSAGSSKKDDDLDLKDVLEVFKNVKGPTADVNYVMSDFANSLRNELLLSPSGKISVSRLATKYLSNIAKFNMLNNSERLYESMRSLLEKNNTLDEVAINAHGELVVLSEDGVDTVSVQEYMSDPSSYQVLTNHNLLDLRYNNTSLAFRDDLYSNISGVGMDQIIQKVNNIVRNLGTTKKEQLSDNMLAIRGGIEFILDLNEEGLDVGLAIGSYMVVRQGLATEEQQDLAKAALSAVLLMLTPLEQALITYHSTLNGGKGLVGTLADLIGSRTSSNIKLTSLISRIFTPSAKKADGTKSDGEDKDDKSNPLMLMLQQQGGTYRTATWITKDGTQSMGTQGVYYPALNNIKDNTSIDKMLSDSGIGGILLSYDGITFGNQRVPTENLKDIMFDKNGGGYVMVLPCTTDTNGNKVVDLSIMDTYKEIVNSLTEPKGSDAWKASLARKIKEKGLNQYLLGDGQLDDKRFGLFLMVNGVTTDKWNFNTDSNWVEKMTPDEATADAMTRALSTNDKRDNYSIDIDDKWGPLEFGYDDIYRATVYIPLNYNINAAINAYGNQVSISSARRYERDYQDLYYRKVQDADSNIGIDLLEQ